MNYGSLAPPKVPGGIRPPWVVLNPNNAQKPNKFSMQETLRKPRKIRKLYINIDGACKGNPGPASIGVLVKDSDGHTLEEYKEFIGKSTSNLAEYKAAVRALEIAAKYCRERVYIFTDSRLLVNHVYGSYKIKNRELFKLLMEIKLLQGFFKCVRFFHVRRNKNSKSHSLASSVFRN